MTAHQFPAPHGNPRVMTRLVACLLLGLALFLAALHTAQAQIRLDLRNVDLRSYVQLVAEQTGRNFIVDPQVEGSVSVFAPVAVTPAAMYEILLNVLEMNSLTIVEGEGVDRIVPMSGAHSLAPGVTGVRRGGAFETRVIPVPAMNLPEIFDVIEPLIAPEAMLTSIPSAGLLVLSDRHENIARIEALVARLGEASSRSVDAVRLNHARAAELVTVLQTAAPPSGGEGSLAADNGANAIVIRGPA